jgi:uncharacterized protein YrrD
MKTAQQIIGLPVVSIFDGNEIGKVKNVIINASKGTIDFFIIDSGIRSLAGGVIPADRVLGIGEYALTIEQPDDISDIVKIPAAIELMQKNITVRGTRVLTKKGSLLGETGDIYIDDEGYYNITGVEFVPADNSNPSGIIPRGSIITFGKNLLVVQDDIIDKLIKTPAAIVVEEEKKNNNLDLSTSVTEEKDDLFRLDGFDPVDSLKAEDEVSVLTEEAIPVAVEEPSTVSDSDLNLNLANDYQPDITHQAEEQPLSAAELFEQRQRQYLVGKKVTKTIYDASGGTIVNAGDTITDKLILDMKASGKLIELVMNYEE